MKLFRLMNLSTDVAERMTIKRAQRKHAAKQRDLILAKQPGVIAVDMLPITIDLDDHFNFEGLPDGHPGHILNFKGKQDINQGQWVAIIGGSEAGKRTLLQLIAGKQLPGRLNTHGTNMVFVPAHLRVITVSENSMFYSGNLYENLTFGMNTKSKEASPERVLGICRKL